jgi:hypothetical protein
VNAQVSTGWDYVIVTLDGEPYALTRSDEAHQVASAFRHAARHLEVVEAREAERLDRRAARATNLSFAAQGPVGTVSTATTVQRHVVFATGEPCPCSCASVCGCAGGAA